MTEGRRQMAEDRWQKIEDGRQNFLNAECGMRNAEV
jgi:hypothetical protein